jgi:hypothetical protein
VLPNREHQAVQVMPDDHSNSVPPLPIPNRTVKRAYADDSAATSVKVGYRQASYKRKTPQKCGVFFRPEILTYLKISTISLPRGLLP